MGYMKFPPWVQNANIKLKTYSSTSLLQLEKASSGNDCSLFNDKSLQEKNKQQVTKTATKKQ